MVSHRIIPSPTRWFFPPVTVIGLSIPHEVWNSMDISAINHSEIGVMFTNLAILGAPPCTYPHGWFHPLPVVASGTCGSGAGWSGEAMRRSRRCRSTCAVNWQNSGKSPSLVRLVGKFTLSMDYGKFTLSISLISLVGKWGKSISFMGKWLNGPIWKIGKWTYLLYINPI